MINSSGMLQNRRVDTYIQVVVFNRDSSVSRHGLIERKARLWQQNVPVFVTDTVHADS